MHAEEFQAKHETQLIHDQLPSYDPAVYGGTYPDRFHIKTVQVSKAFPSSPGRLQCPCIV